MAEYINREDVYNTLKAMYCDECTDEKCQMCEYAKIMFVLDNLPIANVQPVKRGHWYDVGAEYIKEIGQFKIHAFCSECHRLNHHFSDYSQNMETEFCQHCGADMREPEPIKG